ncbi:MAG: efflux RND transporter periplasmic adaptor subunit [Planctomycetes bacterium]|nr:efflux RND transporter periplasmic adaptor subunit [Planctomycetota bacterium]
MTSTTPRLRWSRLVLILLVPAAIGAGGWYTIARGTSMFGEHHPKTEESKSTSGVTVEVVSPRPGGIARVSVQPGTVEPFESTDLYAKASGFLIEQNVDIGSRVTKGEILARISVPEYQKQVDRDEARVKAATAKIHQMEAHIAAAEAEAKAADASVTFAKVSVRAKTAFRKYREKQLTRIKELVSQKALEGRLMDEQEDFYLSALESENAAGEAVTSSEERASAASAKIIQARADWEEAKASAGVAAAELEKSKVLRDYTILKSPYTGVVTRRSFHPGAPGELGDFIKSADQGGTTPLLTVERTDVMRVVIQVPDRDVPYLSTNATAVVEIDALPGIKFDTNGKDKLKVSRWAKAEDPTTRTMRVEVDVKNPVDELNPDGILSHGMYGRVTLTLRQGVATAVRVPTGVVVGREGKGKGTVRVVRGERIQSVPVILGSDNGVEVEVLTGLTSADRVVLRTSGPVDDGAKVAIAGAKAADAGH